MATSQPLLLDAKNHDDIGILAFIFEGGRHFGIPTSAEEGHESRVAGGDIFDEKLLQVGLVAVGLLVEEDGQGLLPFRPVAVRRVFRVDLIAELVLFVVEATDELTHLLGHGVEVGFVELDIANRLCRERQSLNT